MQLNMRREKVEVTNRQLLEISTSLGYLTRKETEAWYQIGRNIKIIGTYLDDINESKKMIFDKFAERDKHGEIKYTDETKSIVDFGNNGEKADEAWTAVQDEKVEVDFYKFSHSLLAGTKINPGMIAPLIDIIIVE